MQASSATDQKIDHKCAAIEETLKAIGTDYEQRKQSEDAERALEEKKQAITAAQERAKEEKRLRSTPRNMWEDLLNGLADEAAECDELGDTEAADGKRLEIEQVKQQIEDDRKQENKTEDPLPCDLLERVEFRAARKPFRPGLLDDFARCTGAEMAANITAISDDALGKDAMTHSLCFHFTTLASLDLIMGGNGLRASVAGQLNGGLRVCLASMSQLNWAQWSGNRFREKVGKDLWGTKWKDLLRTGKTSDGVDIIKDGTFSNECICHPTPSIYPCFRAHLSDICVLPGVGKDRDKIDYVIVLKVRNEMLADKKRIVSGRDNVYIIHKDHLAEIDGFHFLGGEHIVKVLRLSNPAQEASMTEEVVVTMGEKVTRIQCLAF